MASNSPRDPQEASREAGIVDAFNRDVETNAGYLYTTDAKLSSRLANERLTDVALKLFNFQGKTILDVGCGDGAYTVELYDRGKPSRMVAFDPAANAIEMARQKAGGRNIAFEVQSAYELPYADGEFDLAHLRGVLHHMDNPRAALKEALRVARHVIFIEPNGYNPVLKLLEKFSSYHIAHGEKSYPPPMLRSWVKEHGGAIEKTVYAGLVPFFCPDFLARTCKLLEPAVELTPVARQLSCAVYVVLARGAQSR